MALERSENTLARVAAGLLAILLALPAFAGIEFAAGPGETTVAGELLVGFQPGTAPASIIQQIAPGATLVPINPGRNIHRVMLPATAAPGVSSRIAAAAGVLYVEPNRIRRSQALVPNDPQLSAQWALQKIQATQAWGLAPDVFLTAASAGTGRIRIAVLDTGVDCTHPDFMNAGGNSTDAAAGGQINWSLSKAYYASTAPVSCAWGDDFGHGTHVAGIIAAAANNGQGVAGIAYPVQILVYKVLQSDGSGDDGIISQGIVDAANAGAAVISLSLGGPGYSQTLQSAINYAWQKNALVVAAAGNGPIASLFFPAGANYAMGVAATGVDDGLASFSNFGPGVAVGAPGVGILSTVPTYANQEGGSGYLSLSGTSMSAPHVSALGGLLSVATPNLSAAAERMVIEESADNGNPGGQAGSLLGYGRINAWRALSGSLRPSSLGGIVGQVVNTSGFPIAGAQVSVAGQTQNLDATALFRFYGIPAGAYTAAVSATGYATGYFQVNVAAGADSNFTPVVGSVAAQFSGTVTDHGQPVSGAVVEALSGGLIQSSAVTGPGGAYTLYVQPGAYDIQTSGLYHVTTTLAGRSVGANGNTVLNLSLPAMGTITGNVTLPNGTPAANATVSVSGPQNTSLATDVNGNYSTIGLAPGGYSVTAATSGESNITAGAAVAVDAASNVNLQFSGGSPPVVPPGPGSGFTTIRVRAGGGSLVDASGNVWSADYGFLGGSTYSDSNPVANTSTPALYQSQRFNLAAPVQYQFAVPNGSYTVVLKFAETWFSSAGQRIFNIVLNGQTVAPDFDIAAAAGGANIAIDVSYSMNVTNGQINIALTPLVQNPEINAIEIAAGSGQAAGYAAIRVRAGSNAPYTDSLGQIWSADSGNSGGATYSVTTPIRNTPDQPLYQTERYSGTALQYQFAAPNGFYSVLLKFSENWFNAPGARIFNIVINGKTVETRFDIAAAAGGAFTAVDKRYLTQVTNGQVVVEFVPVVQNPKVDAIQILSN